MVQVKKGNSYILYGTDASNPTENGQRRVEDIHSSHRVPLPQFITFVKPILLVSHVKRNIKRQNYRRAHGCLSNDYESRVAMQAKGRVQRLGTHSAINVT